MVANLCSNVGGGILILINALEGSSPRPKIQPYQDMNTLVGHIPSDASFLPVQQKGSISVTSNIGYDVQDFLNNLLLLRKCTRTNSHNNRNAVPRRVSGLTFI